MIIYVNPEGQAHTVDQMHEYSDRFITFAMAVKAAWHTLKEAMEAAAKVFVEWWESNASDIKGFMAKVAMMEEEYEQQQRRLEALEDTTDNWHFVKEKHNHISRLNIKTRQRRSSFARHKGWSIKTTYQRG